MTRISNREEFGRKIFSRTVKTLRQNVKSWQHFDLSMIEGVSTKWLFVRERSWIVIGGLFEIGLLGPLNSISFPRLKILQLLCLSAILWIYSAVSVGKSRRKMVKGVPAQLYSIQTHPLRRLVDNSIQKSDFGTLCWWKVPVLILKSLWSTLNVQSTSFLKIRSTLVRCNLVLEPWVVGQTSELSSSHLSSGARTPQEEGQLVSEALT